MSDKSITEESNMPGRARIILSGNPLHIIQRDNIRQAYFCADEDYHAYLEWPGNYAKRSHYAVHAYMLMTIHVLLLVTPRTTSGAGALMKKRSSGQSA